MVVDAVYAKSLCFRIIAGLWTEFNVHISSEFADAGRCDWQSQSALYCTMHTLTTYPHKYLCHTIKLNNIKCTKLLFVIKIEMNEIMQNHGLVVETKRVKINRNDNKADCGGRGERKKNVERSLQMTKMVFRSTVSVWCFKHITIGNMDEPKTKPFVADCTNQTRASRLFIPKPHSHT